MNRTRTGWLSFALTSVVMFAVPALYGPLETTYTVNHEKPRVVVMMLEPSTIQNHGCDIAVQAGLPAAEDGSYATFYSANIPPLPEDWPVRAAPGRQCQITIRTIAWHWRWQR